MTSEALVNAIHPEILPKLDPQFAEIYTRYQAPYLRADQVSYDVYNADRSKYTFSIAEGPYPQVLSLNTYKIPVTEPDGEIAIDVYTPTEEAVRAAGSRSEKGLPAHVNFHGGGFVIGSLASDASWCRQICLGAGCIVVNVDYRMAPKYAHPVPGNDSWAALQWVFWDALSLGIDSSRISVGGFSAGGQIAAVLALRSREAEMPLVLQMLVVPCVDARFMPIEGAARDAPYESYTTCEFAPCLPLQRMRWFYNLWLGTDVEKRREMAEHWLASPIIASSHKDLAPASFHVAEIDTLFSEGIAYHHVLQKAGTPSRLKVYEGCGHPFGHWEGKLDKAKEFVQDTIDALNRAYKL